MLYNASYGYYKIQRSLHILIMTDINQTMVAFVATFVNQLMQNF